ncbi:MAG: AI-2E family transporter [Lachnospiraceae bacterium]|nr:AI-2E family transporter [Lachnospiraceae bacterium]
MTSDNETTITTPDNRIVNDENAAGDNTTENESGGNSDAYYNRDLQFGKSGPSRIRQYFTRGFTYFLVLAAGIAFYYALQKLPNVSDAFSKVYQVLKPVVYGFVIAYLLTPIVNRADKILLPAFAKRNMKDKTAKKLSRIIGVVAALLLFIALIVALCNLLIPELYKSIRNLVVTLPDQLDDWVDKINEMQNNETTIGALITTIVNEGTETFMSWLRNDVLAETNKLMTNLTSGIISFINEITSFLIGIFVSVYLLFGKERFAMQAKKTIYAVFKPRNANNILHITNKSHQIFGGFIFGKVIDSIIIGILCFIGLSILRMPYTILVSVVVGVTNVIPFFGPYFGAISSAILILLVDPVKAIYFIIFIILLQQFDGSILGPKILGDSTGLSAFWVIVAILLGGGLFGFPGMVLGVPAFAVFYYLAETFINGKLAKRHLPVDSSYYRPKSFVTDEGSYVPDDRMPGARSSEENVKEPVNKRESRVKSILKSLKKKK